MADESRTDQLRDLALPWEKGHALAVACAVETVKDMRMAFNKFAETDPYEAGKPELWDLSSAPGESDPAVRAMTLTFTHILNRRGLLKSTPPEGNGASV